MKNCELRLLFSIRNVQFYFFCRVVYVFLSHLGPLHNDIIWQHKFFACAICEVVHFVIPDQVAELSVGCSVLSMKVN